MKSSKRSLLRMSIFQNLWLTWINQPINKYEWLLYMCHLLVIQIYSIFQTTVKILITTIQKETLRAAGLKKQRPDEVHFLNQSIFPATTIPPQLLKLSWLFHFPSPQQPINYQICGFCTDPSHNCILPTFSLFFRLPLLADWAAPIIPN